MKPKDFLRVNMRNEFPEHFKIESPSSQLSPKRVLSANVCEKPCWHNDGDLPRSKRRCSEEYAINNGCSYFSFTRAKIVSVGRNNFYFHSKTTKSKNYILTLCQGDN